MATRQRGSMPSRPVWLWAAGVIRTNWFGTAVAGALLLLSALKGNWWLPTGLLVGGAGALGLRAAVRRLPLAFGVQTVASPGLLEARNRQLQSLLQASRAISSALELAPTANRVAEQVVQHTPFQRVALVLGPEPGSGYRLAAGVGLEAAHRQALDTLLRRNPQQGAPWQIACSTLQPVVVEDVRQDFRTQTMRDVLKAAGIAAFLAVPMVVQGRCTGALTVFLDRPGRLDASDVSLVTALAGQAAMALENARLYTLSVQSRQRLDQALTFLESIASALAHSRVGVGPLLQQVTQVVAGFFAPARVQLMVDGLRPGSSSKAGDGGHQGHMGTSGPQPGSIQAPNSDVPVARAEAGTEWMAGVAGAELPVAAQVSLPITLDSRDIGRLEIELLGKDRSLDEEERSTLRALVHLTASALGNAHLVQELRQAADGVEQAYMGTLEALLRALETRDHETEGHSRRVVQYTLALAQQLGVQEEQLVAIMRGALLHDIGKIGIPDHILRKPGPLTAEEWEVMKTHSQIGHEMLQPIDFLRDATPIVRHHHERYDGTGYPDSLIGEAIPLGARIFAVADAYDALTSDRPYRRGRSHEEAVAEIVRCAGTHFDPRVVEAFLRVPGEELARIRRLREEAVW